MAEIEQTVWPAHCKHCLHPKAQRVGHLTECQLCIEEKTK